MNCKMYTFNKINISVFRLLYLPTHIDSTTFKMAFINLFDLKEWSSVDDGLGLIKYSQEFGVLATEPNCIRGHPMKLVKDQTVIDNYKWVGRKTLGDAKKKKRQTLQL